MSRLRRPDVPGAIFHLNTRTQGAEPWFTPELRGPIVEYTAEAFRKSDSRLLAYAVMPNHLHLVLRQGKRAASRLMQQLLTRVALLVKRANGTEGHVFGGRYHHVLCDNPKHQRIVIAYVNRNPTVAGLVRKATSYPWCSERAYAGARGAARCMADVLALEEGLELFGATGGELAPGPNAYIHHVRDRRLDTPEGLLALTKAVDPGLLSGDELESALTAIARRVMSEHRCRVPLDLIRTSRRTRAITEMRRLLVTAMSDAGFRNQLIARYLRVTDQCVSAILVRHR